MEFRYIVYVLLSASVAIMCGSTILLIEILTCESRKRLTDSIKIKLKRR